jgi:lipoate-protein ligase B
MEQLVFARREGRIPDTLLLLEHPPVITLGRSADPSHVRISAAERLARGIALEESSRGGGVTYHGPGQLVGYPIVALPPGRRDAHRYLRDLEEAMILAAGDFGAKASRRPGFTGIWARGAKLGSVGVRISIGWVASHGFALNVAMDLSGFEAIVPCGIEGCRATSLEELTGLRVPVKEVGRKAAARLGEVLGLDPIEKPDLPDGLLPAGNLFETASRSDSSAVSRS